MKCFSAILTIVFLSSFLTACGSGGSGEAETSVDGATDTQVSSSQEQIQTGVFVDAAVSGVSYRTRTQQGITNEQGEFQYIEGEMVTFSIGGITLGTVYGAKVITPVQLTESESPADAAALNQLVFLQSLDLNSDSDDGIQISEQAHNLAENLKLDFDSRMFSEEAAILVAQLSGGANGLVSEEDALTHFYETYDELGGAIVFGFEFSEPLTGNTDTDSEQNSDDSSTDNSGDEAGDNSQNNSGNNSGDSTDYNSDDYNDGSSGEGSGGEEGGSGDGSGGNSENGSGDSSNTGTVAVTVLVQAEDYVDYYDIDPGNNGNGYRTEDVDIESTTDIDGGFNVGWTAIGEWLDYNVELEAGVYAVSTRVASQVSSGSYSLLLNNASFASDSVMSTGGWQNFVTHTVGSLEVVSSGTHVLRLLVTGNEFNINWIKFTPINDADGDGVGDASDQCPTTPEGLDVDLLGCEIIPVEQEVSYANERLIGGLDSAFPGFTLYVFDNDQSSPGSSVCNNGCASSWPPVLVEDAGASGVSGLSTIERDDGTMQAAHNGRPLYFYVGDNSAADTNGDGVGGVWSLVSYGVLGDITRLYNEQTVLEPDTQFETADALITRFSDRPRTRHAREDEFQSYDHYIKFYFEDRSSNIEIIDYVAKGGDTIEMNVRTIFPLSDREAENRWWYTGTTTVAAYASNGIMSYEGFDGTYYHYKKTSNENTRLGREIRIGDRMEFEISQFSAPGIPRGQANYYGTTFLYIVGEGIVPWYAEAAGSQFREDSQKIPEEYWLGGHTSIHYQYTDEPNDHFMQMATNLGYDNGQTFLEGRRVHHSSVVDGTHDEDPANGVFSPMVGLAGTKYINQRCSDCHERNGSAPVAENGELLDRWVFKIGDVNGAPDPVRGRVLQPNGNAGEGDVSIASWTELANGLRKPNYQFDGGTPATFSARIAPRLVGLGLLEAIPETAILALEDPYDANGDGISGRANKVIDPENGSLTRLGRFGWKAATFSIKHQVAAALNTDLGVRTSMLPNPDCGSNQSECGTDSPLMPGQYMEDLVLYLSTLGVRPQRVWQNGVEDQEVLQGQALFNTIGCTGCHTDTFQTSKFHPLAEVRDQTIHPYSDMLLHDMGEGLADNLGEGQASGSEWRTTPLWGLGLSACVTGGVVNPTGREGDEVCTPHHAYLHDGRARSIEEAILWHGGEGQASNDSYQSLSAEQKQLVLRFLESL